MSHARAQFVEDLGSALAQMGLPRMPSRVFALLLAASEDTLTARELADQLSVSPAAISGAVRYLTQWQMVTRTRLPGERLDRFGIGRSFWEATMAAEAAAYGLLIGLCDRALEEADLAEKARFRVTESRDFLEFMAAEMPLVMERWKASRST